MTPSQTVPAVLLYYVGFDLQRYPMHTVPAMLSPVDEALTNLRMFKAAMVAECDRDTVLAAVEKQEQPS